jgi:hypothetical protein
MTPVNVRTLHVLKIRNFYNTIFYISPNDPVYFISFSHQPHTKSLLYLLHFIFLFQMCVLLILIEPILKILNLFSLGLGLELEGADSAFL